MPYPLNDAKIAKRSNVLEQHNGLVFRGTVTTYTDTTHFKVSSLPDYGNADDFPDEFFKDYYAYVVWDAGATGAAPQGESQPVSAYSSLDGGFTHTAFTVPVAVGDEILLIHPSALNASVLADLDEIKGTGFVTADDSLEAISTEISEILDLTRTEGDITVSAAETNLFIDDAPTKINNGISIKINTSNMAAGDTFKFREKYRIKSGGGYEEIADPVSLTGAQASPLYIIKLDAYRYGCTVTAEKIAGTDRNFEIEAIVEA